MENISTQVIAAFVFGIIFVIVLIAIAIKFPHPTPFQYNVFRIILSLAAAGVAAMIPGFINVEFSKTTEIIIRAGGALAVFVVVYFFNPAKLALHHQSQDPIDNEPSQASINSLIPATPKQLPSGEDFPSNKIVAFNEVWRTLIALENAGQDLWDEVSVKNITAFKDKIDEAERKIANNALFFSGNDYDSLDELLHSAKYYLLGKEILMEMRERNHKGIQNTKGYAWINDDQLQKKAEHRIRQNKRWLSRYRNLLSQIRNNLHNIAYQ
ncbi:MAG TPA: hypothetical protein VF596_18660 [Pyrinomonadaceae bacterium]|jgi:hypothetical protein